MLPLTFALAVVSATPQPAEVAAARQLAKDGFKLADAGKCAAAIEPLARAESLFHAPTILVRLAECHLTLGKVLLATEELRRVTVEDLGPTPSKAFVNAKGRARALLAAAEPRLGHATVRITGPEAPVLVVRLDGEPLAVGMLGLEIPVDPGSHRVQAEADGFTAAEGTFTVAEGGSQTVELELKAVPVDPTEPPAALQPRAPSPRPSAPVSVANAPPAASRSNLRLPAWLTLGVGVVGFGAGIGFGVAALNDKAALDGVCVNKACPPSAKAGVNSLQRDATVSTIGWAVGGVAAATSLVLFVLLSISEPQRVGWLLPGQGSVLVRW